MWHCLVLISGLLLAKADMHECDTYPRCKMDADHLEVNHFTTEAPLDEGEGTKVLNELSNFLSTENNSSQETSLESPLNSMVTDEPKQSALRDFRLFDESQDTRDVDITSSFEFKDEEVFTEQPVAFSSVKINNALILRELAEFEGKQKTFKFDDHKRPTVSTMMSTLVFPPLPRGDQYRVHSLGLQNGYFIFNFMGTLLSFIQPATYPLELSRDVLVHRQSLLDLFIQSTSYEPGTIALLTMGALFGVGTPLTLLIICCVRMVRGCKEGKADEANDCSDSSSSHEGSCKRVALAFTLLLLLILTATGITGVIIANEQVRSGATRFPTVIDTALGDTRTFIRNSHQHLRFIVTSAIDQAVEATSADLNNIESLLGRPVQREIASETGVDVALDLLADISMAAQSMAEKCTVLQQNAGSTRQLARTTQERLTELRSQIDVFRRQCPSRERPLCDTLDTAGLEVAVNFDRLIGDLKLTQMKRFRNDTLTSLAQQARTELQFVPNQLEADTRDARTGLRRQLEHKRNELYDSLIPLDQLSRHLEHRVQSFKDSNLETFEKLPDVEQWRWLIGISTGLSLIFIWIFLFSAITCGCCGAERHAGCAIVTSLVLLALLSTALWIIAMAVLILGSRGEILVCRALKQEPHFQIMSSIFDTSPALFGSRSTLLANLAYSNDTLDVPLATVLSECRDNRPAYSAFRLQKVFDVDKSAAHRSWTGYNTELSKLSVDLRHLQILSPELSKLLTSLLEASAVDLAAHRSQLSGHVTSRDLKSFASQLEGVANQIRDQTTKSRLEQLVDRTRRLLSNNVQPLEKQKDDLVYQLTALEVQLLPLQKQVNQSLSHLKTIQYFITNQGSTIAQEKSTQYAERLQNYVQQFQDYVLDSIKGSIAPCRPVWNSFEAARQITCDHVTDSLNGLWFCLSWNLMFFLAAIPTSIALRNQYSRLKKSSLLARTTEGQDSPPAATWTSQSNAEESGNW